MQLRSEQHVHNMALEGKTAVVFGGTGGIGVEICKHLLKNGLSKLAVLDVNELLADAKDQITGCNAEAELISEKCDITNKMHMEKVIRNQVLPKLGCIDLFVNSAGVIDECDPDHLVAVNLTGVINSSLLAMKLMSKENAGGKGGMIVNVSSVAGLEPVSFMSVYAASKFGVTGFTRSMADNLIYNQTGVKFLTICPGFTDTTLLTKLFAGEDLLFPWIGEIIPEVKKQYQAQSPSTVGECLVQAVLDGDNGAVWICLDGSNYKMEIPANQFLIHANAQ